MVTKTLTRVQKGAAHLDAHFPDGWAHKIDFDTLNMGDWSTCIVGQLTPDLRPEDFGHVYLYGTDRLSVLGLSDNWMALGFDFNVDPEEWRAEVDKRLAD